jgi:hypothetical protein
MTYSAILLAEAILAKLVLKKQVLGNTIMLSLVCDHQLLLLKAEP